MRGSLVHESFVAKHCPKIVDRAFLHPLGFMFFSSARCSKIRNKCNFGNSKLSGFISNKSRALRRKDLRSEDKIVRKNVDYCL